MANVDVKGIRQKCNVMNDAWVEGAPSAKFNGIAQDAFQTALEAAVADDAAIADLESELKMKRDVRDENTRPSTNNAPKSAWASLAIRPTATTARFTVRWASSVNPRRSRV